MCSVSRTKLLFSLLFLNQKKTLQSVGCGLDCSHRVPRGSKGSYLRGCLDLSSPQLLCKQSAQEASLPCTWMRRSPSHCSARILDTRKKKYLCALVGSLLRISASSCFFFCACLNETAPVVCYEKKKANNPSLNNRAELKKKILAPGCPSASGPGIRLQLAQLHSLAQAIFSRKKT